MGDVNGVNGDDGCAGVRAWSKRVS